MTGIRLLQRRARDGVRNVIFAEGETAVLLTDVDSVRSLALAAIENGETLEAAARARRSDVSVDLASELAAGHMLPAIDHPDSARLWLTGTGLTHLGSAAGRDAMHRAASAGQQTDSMRLFLEGVERGRPATGEVGAQPEWFYKGDGQSLVAPEAALVSPSFAKDGSEEPELAGVYLVDGKGDPWRLGFALANEFSDHVTERHNYLWLAHSKLRPASLGAELLIGDLPEDIQGLSRIRRSGETIWEKPFLTGEANMAHSIENLEHHHFKYDLFRRPGDIHVHFFGTATLSFSDTIRTEAGDIFEIEAAPFQLPLRNFLTIAQAADVAKVRTL